VGRATQAIEQDEIMEVGIWDDEREVIAVTSREIAIHVEAQYGGDTGNVWLQITNLLVCPLLRLMQVCRHIKALTKISRRAALEWVDGGRATIDRLGNCKRCAMVHPRRRVTPYHCVAPSLG
jgi:hypothetical protein